MLMAFEDFAGADFFFIGRVVYKIGAAGQGTEKRRVTEMLLFKF
jgi:hypothetical protein